MGITIGGALRRKNTYQMSVIATSSFLIISSIMNTHTHTLQVIPGYTLGKVFMFVKSSEITEVKPIDLLR